MKCVCCRAGVTQRSGSYLKCVLSYDDTINILCTLYLTQYYYTINLWNIFATVSVSFVILVFSTDCVHGLF